jgi:hypothetical protein
MQQSNARKAFKLLSTYFVMVNTAGKLLIRTFVSVRKKTKLLHNFGFIRINYTTTTLFILDDDEPYEEEYRPDGKS